jgi:hypothetical protein
MMGRRIATWTMALFASEDDARRRIIAALLATLLLGIGSLGMTSRRSTSVQPKRQPSILYLPTPEPSHGDTCEPNDSWEDACGPLAPGAVYQFYILCRDATGIDDDWYYINVGKTDPITISLTSIPPGTDCGLYLYYSYNGEMKGVARSDNQGNADEHILYTPETIGKYFIRVYPWEGCSDTDPYSLAASYAPPLPPVAWRHTPPERDVTLTVGQCQDFVVQATDEDCDLRGVEWYVDDEHQISHFTLSGCSGVDTYSRCFGSPGTQLVEATVFDSLEVYSEIMDWNVTVMTPTPTPVCNVKVDDFGDTNPNNDLGGPSRWFVTPESCGDASVCYNGAELEFDYDIRNGPYCSAVYETGFEVDAINYSSLVFRFKGENVSTGFGLVCLANEFPSTGGLKVMDFLDGFQPSNWQNVVIPLAAFGNVSYLPQELSFTLEFSHTILPADWQDTAFLDSIRLETATVPLMVDNFNDGSPPNALGSPITAFASKGAEIGSDHDNQSEISRGSGYYFIQYRVPENDAYAVWETGLANLDTTPYDRLSFYVKRGAGTDRAHIYLQDPWGSRVYVDMDRYAAVDQAWQLVTIPLADFAGVNLTDLQSLQFAFEWEALNGLIFLDDIRFLPTSIMVDDFCDEDYLNSLGGEAGTFVGEGCAGTITQTYMDHYLRLDYDVTAGEECFVGYFSKSPLDLNPYGSVSLQAKGERCGDVAEVGLNTDDLEPKITVSDYLEEGLTHVWQDVSIPLDAFAAITDRTSTDELTVAFSNRIGSSQGTTYWDNLRYDRRSAPLMVDNFNDGTGLNALRGWITSYTTSTATITHGYDYLTAYGDTGASQAITYMVPSNEYAVWQTSLEAVNLSNYDALSFMIKGAAGDERPNIYMYDSLGKKGFINIETYHEVTRDWQNISIPLQNFGHDIDLTSLATLQIAFEWEQMQGTVYLDNIQFLPSHQSYTNRVFLPLVLKPPPDFLPSKWDFESEVEGWQHQTYPDSQAVIAVEQSSLRARSGFYSLAMITDLIGGHISRTQGEAFVDLIADPPPGVTAPVNLEGVEVTCWVYAPTCAMGDPEHPNTIQLFVKDESAESEYAAPVDVISGAWFQISLTPSKIKPLGDSMDDGFDPNSITLVGVRIKAPEGSSQRYRGKVYIDACGW